MARIVFVVIAAAALWFFRWEPFPQFHVAIGLVALAFGASPIFKEAFENVLERRMTMELSMTIALVAAASIGQVTTSLVMTAFVLAAEMLEHRTVARGRDAIRDLLQYLPRTAVVRRDGKICEIDAAALGIGDAVLVNPGALVPVDGTVVAGASYVDEQHVTGESAPVEKTPGSRAYAGTVNQRGVLEIRAEQLGRETSFGRIIDAVESAEQSRAPIERLADRLAGVLVVVALGAAALTFLVTRDVVATISVVIVAGACGIAAGTPLAVLGAIGQAARAGAIVKGGRYLEALATVDVVVFDKTGTLTSGRPQVVSLDPAPGVTPERLLHAAAIAERRSEHPLGTAIVARALELGMTIGEPDEVRYLPGRGLHAVFGGETIVVGNAALLRDEGLVPGAEPGDGFTTSVHVASGGQTLGTIGIADAVRPEAAAAIAALKAMAVPAVLLTGDARRVAIAVAHSLGIDTVEAGLLPEEKSAYVGRLVDAGKIVAMVGDGVNDAPALVRATIGVAMGSGTDVARECADIVLLGNDVSRFVDTVRIARRTRAIVMQNFVGTLAVDAIGILLAARGFLPPLVAALVHVVSELAFILNATRMLAPSGVKVSTSTQEPVPQLFADDTARMGSLGADRHG